MGEKVDRRAIYDAKMAHSRIHEREKVQQEKGPISNADNPLTCPAQGNALDGPWVANVGGNVP